MKRREFLAAAGGAPAAPLVRAQPFSGKRTLGVLSADPEPSKERIANSPHWVRLRQLGWHEGTNVVVERRFAAGRMDLLDELAADLVKKRVDAIWGQGPEAAFAAARATKTIPIVFWGVPFPVEQGLVDSLPRPGGNVTGIGFYIDFRAGMKPLEFLIEVATHVRRLSTFRVPAALRTVAGIDLMPKFLSEVGAESKRLGIETIRHDIRAPEDFEPAFAAILESRAQAVSVVLHPLTFANRARIIEFLNENRLVSLFNNGTFVEAGGLLSYGPDFGAVMADSARLMDRVLRGAKPADLPVEIPSTWNLVVNLKTAAHLGLKVPRTIIMRANKLIE